MANPSLQIGNSKWAIKEDSLLGYTELGNNIAPVEIDMTRASAGTRVNSSGLVETVELLGSEQVVNGDFATDSDWGKETGWSISGGSGNCDGSQTGMSSLTPNANNVTNGVLYKATYTISNYSSGSIRIKLGNTGYGQYNSANGTYTEYITAIATSFPRSQINADVDFIGSIDNVSVKEVTRNNLARVDYTGSTSSLLAEPQRTNLVTYSEVFSDSSWSNTGTTESIAASITDPSGSNNSYKLIESSSTGFHFINTLTSTLSGANTLSFYAKSSERTQVSAFLSQSGNVGAIFDLSAETSTPSGTGNTSTIENVGNGWYRCVVSNNGSSQISNNIRIGVQNGALDSYTGDGTSGVFIWGAQVEQGSYATSYIPTSGSTVTRVQDQFSKTGISDKINSAEGVLFVEMAALSDDGSERYIVLSDGTWNNRIQISFISSNRITTRVNVSGSTQYNATDTVSDITEYTRIALSWKEDDFKTYFNGVEVSSYGSGIVPNSNVLNGIYFGGDDGSVNRFFGKVKQLQVFKTALTDSELATLTT